MPTLIFTTQLASQAVLHPGPRDPGARDPGARGRASQPVHPPPNPAAAAGSVQPQARHGSGVGRASDRFVHPGNPPPAKNTGRWTEDEHHLFIQGIQLHGKDWTKISSFMNGSRTRSQVYSHAITYFKNNPEAEAEATRRSEANFNSETLGGFDADVLHGSTHETITQEEGLLQLAGALGQSSYQNQDRGFLPAVETTAATMIDVGQARRQHLDENTGERYFDRSLAMNR